MTGIPLPSGDWSPIPLPTYPPYSETELHLVIRVSPDFAFLDMTDYERMAAAPSTPGLTITMRRFDRARAYFLKEMVDPQAGTARLETWHALLDDRCWISIGRNVVNSVPTAIFVRENRVTPCAEGTTWLVHCRDWVPSKPNARIPKLAASVARRALERSYAQSVQLTEEHYRAR